ncbi:MAG: hypothetical protein IJJ34_00480 [Clostridia bacterium]|nr:hypothetical protein [Clostridia bacterium]
MAAKKRPLKPITLDSLNVEYAPMPIVGNLALQAMPIYGDPAETEKKQKAQKPQLHIVPDRKKAPQQKKTVSVPRARIQFKKASKMRIVLFVVGIMLGGVMLVSKKAMIAKNNSLIARKETELENLTRQSEQLEIQYAMTDDLNTVMAIASEELGMGIPQDEMRREVALQERHTDIVEAEEDTHTGDGILMAMFDRISDSMR